LAEAYTGSLLKIGANSSIGVEKSTQKSANEVRRRHFEAREDDFVCVDETFRQQRESLRVDGNRIGGRVVGRNILKISFMVIRRDFLHNVKRGFRKPEPLVAPESDVGIEVFRGTASISGHLSNQPAIPEINITVSRDRKTFMV
jgi:hypothetical protein